MHLYYSGVSKNAPATREVIEVFLMDEFHWTPDEISKIPYKKIQKLLAVRSAKHNAQEARVEMDNVRRQMKDLTKTSGSGRTKRVTREV